MMPTITAVRAQHLSRNEVFRRLTVVAGAARQRPSFALYLAALAMFPFQWLSPFSYEQAGWPDVFIAAAVAAWILEAVRARRVSRPRAVHYALAAYFLFVVLSGLISTAPRAASARNVVTSAELIFIAVLTSDYARSSSGRGAIARVTLWVTFVAAVEALIGLLLFYLGDTTSLVAGFSTYFKTSSVYTRVAAGFYSPPLLGSFCIFASAVLALDDNGLSRRMRFTGQVVLTLLVLATISRPVIAFAMALAIREAHRRGTRRARRVVTASVVAGVTVLIALTVLPFSLDPLRPPSSKPGINPRLAFIESAGHSISAHPLLGQGPGSLAANWYGRPYRAHFTPLNVAATTGLLSLLALVALVILLWWRRRRPTNVAIWSGLLGLGVDGLTQDIEHFRHVWMAFGMADADRREGDSSGERVEEDEVERESERGVIADRGEHMALGPDPHVSA